MQSSKPDQALLRLKQAYTYTTGSVQVQHSDIEAATKLNMESTKKKQILNITSLHFPSTPLNSHSNI